MFRDKNEQIWVWGIALIIILHYMWLPHLKGKVSYIVDGDTIYIQDTKIHLFGIDAPEINQECSRINGKNFACGRIAKRYLEHLISQKEIECIDQHITDKYRRIVAICYVDGKDINAMMVHNGMAIAYTKYMTEELYAIKHTEEAIAHGNIYTIWQGFFDYPEDVRQKRQQEEIQYVRR